MELAVLADEYRDTQNRLERLLRFIKKYDFLHKFQVVNFLVEGTWESLPTDWRLPLLELSDAELIKLPHETQKASWPASLKEFFHEAHQLSLQRTPAPFLETSSITDHWLKLNMTPKKKHEVERLSKLIGEVCAKLKDPLIVDVGSGEGYLSTAIALQHNLPLVAIDCSQSNTEGAQKRSEKIAEGVAKRTYKAATAEKDTATTSNSETIEKKFPRKDTELEPYIAKVQSQIKHVTHFLSRDMTEKDWFKVLKIDPSTRPSIVLIGLHVCGELVPLMEHLYSHSDCIKALVCVGCCYYRMAYKDEKTKCFETHGHPLSDASRRAFEAASGVEKGLTHCLSPGALSLACESSATWTAMSADEFDWMLRATFYRCLLETYTIHWLRKDQLNSYHLRGIARSKCTSFSSYMEEVMKRLRKQIAPEIIGKVQLDPAEVIERFKKYESSMRQLAVFLTLRTVIAGVLETYVVLDRYAYLHEQQSRLHQSAPRLLPLFDPVLSPRNMMSKFLSCLLLFVFISSVYATKCISSTKGVDALVDKKSTTAL